MTNVARFPTSPARRRALFDREIEGLVAPGLAADLAAAPPPQRWLAAQASLDAAARHAAAASPAPETRPPPSTTALAIARVIADLSLSGQRRLLAIAEKLADAEAMGHVILRADIVTAIAVDEARA